MTAMGHEERFPPPRLNGRCGFRKRSLAVDVWPTGRFLSSNRHGTCHPATWEILGRRKGGGGPPSGDGGSMSPLTRKLSAWPAVGAAGRRSYSGKRPRARGRGGSFVRGRPLQQQGDSASSRFLGLLGENLGQAGGWGRFHRGAVALTDLGRKGLSSLARIENMAPQRVRRTDPYQ